jgi:hypothetical protein
MVPFRLGSPARPAAVRVAVVGIGIGVAVELADLEGGLVGVEGVQLTGGEGGG